MFCTYTICACEILNLIISDHESHQHCGCLWICTRFDKTREHYPTHQQTITGLSSAPARKRCAVTLAIALCPPSSSLSLPIYSRRCATSVDGVCLDWVHGHAPCVLPANFGSGLLKSSFDLVSTIMPPLLRIRRCTTSLRLTLG